MKNKILIADDEAALLSTMAFTLKRKGYETYTFIEGRSAYEEIINSFQNNKLYDLIITDIQMPGLSGMELTRKIREAGIETPVLAISGFGNKKMLDNLTKLGCNDYLDKPFHMNEFLDRISKLIKENDTKILVVKIKKQADKRIQLNRTKGEVK